MKVKEPKFRLRLQDLWEVILEQKLTKNVQMQIF